MRHLVVTLTLSMLACGDFKKPWDLKGAPKVSPNVQYRTGTEVGDDIYVWHCLENQRIEIRQHSSAMCGASDPVMTKGACVPPGETEAIASKSEDVPGGLRWPGSPPPIPRDLLDASVRDN